MPKPIAARSTLEKTIEQAVVNYALQRGVRSYKLNVLGRRNLPDRLFLVPENLAVFMEFKIPGAVPRPGQAHEHKLLRDAGFIVYVVDSKEFGCKMIELSLAKDDDAAE